MKTFLTLLTFLVIDLNAFAQSLSLQLEVSPKGMGEEGYIHASDQLEYTIRFQNTGNSTISNLTLIDTIDVNSLNFNNVFIDSSS